MESSLREPEMYIRCKQILLEKGWKILGGEPPDGTDNIPRIEMRDPTNKSRGSKGSRKIDLIALKKNKLLLLELKRNYSKSDIKKLDEIVSEEKWRKALLAGLNNKRVFERGGIDNIPDFVNNNELLVKAIGLSEQHSFPRDYIEIVVGRDKYKINFGVDTQKRGVEKYFSNKSGL